MECILTATCINVFTRVHHAPGNCVFTPTLTFQLPCYAYLRPFPSLFVHPLIIISRVRIGKGSVGAVTITDRARIIIANNITRDIIIKCVTSSPPLWRMNLSWFCKNQRGALETAPSQSNGYTAVSGKNGCKFIA